MTPDAPTPAEPPTEGEPEEQHDPTGLALAREMARSLRLQSRRRRKPAYRPTVEPQASGAHPDDRDPQTLSRAVDRLVESKGWSTEVNVHTLLGRWPLLVGGAVGEHSRPEAYADAVLTVRTDSTAWATQLRQMAPQLVAMLNEQLGADTVRFVRVLGPDAPSWKHGTRSVRDGRGPRDTYG